MLRIVFWQRKVSLASDLAQFNFASVSLYNVPGGMIRKALFWTILIFFDRYFGRLLCQIRNSIRGQSELERTRCGVGHVVERPLAVALV